MIGLLVPSDPHVIERGRARRPGSFLPLGTVRLLADLDALPERAVGHPAQAAALAFRPKVGTMGSDDFSQRVFSIALNPFGRRSVCR